jgi:hypothetical protein
VKDAFHEYVVHGRTDAVNPALTGTKAAAQYELRHHAAPCAVDVRLQLAPTDAPALDRAGSDRLFETRKAEADAFYAWITPDRTPADEAAVMRQALAGMLWGKQHYFFDLDRWLDVHHEHPLREGHGSNVRNRDWFQENARHELEVQITAVLGREWGSPLDRVGSIFDVAE